VVRRAPVFLVPAVVCALWTLAAGKDVNWDLLNYHYYVAYELLGGRLQQDFFAASAQSYLNPIGYVPFYLLASGWHSVLASLSLAALHSLSIALLYLLAWRLFAHLPSRDRRVLSLLAAALGAASAVFWPTVGSSFLDPLLAVPMLAGLLLLVDTRRPALAGALFGAASALKYSNAIFALAALPLAFAGPRAARLRGGLAYLGGAALAFGVLAGPWLVLLAREFGNPVFPLMNAWFQSPYAPPMNLMSDRFTPRELTGALAFPLRVATLDTSLYSETLAPDLRFAALGALAIALAALAPWRRGALGRFGAAEWRVFAFFGAALTLWLATSANGRYGLVVLLLAGLCLARAAERLLPLGAARAALAVLLVVQAALVLLAAPARWYVTEPWSRDWLPYAVPERALREPALYLTVEEQPMAVVAPLFHRDSSFVNFRGQYSVPGDSPKLAALLARHRGQLRALGRGLELTAGRPSAQALRFYDDTLARIGYRVDPGECFAVPWRPEAADLLSRMANALAGERPTHAGMLSVASCALRAATRDPAVAATERRLSVLFDRIEQECRGLFRGQRAITEALGSGWSRYYPGLDARLESDGERIVLNHYRKMTESDLGRASEWAAGKRAAACR
jgi:hypothetical protein